MKLKTLLWLVVGFVIIYWLSSPLGETATPASTARTDALAPYANGTWVDQGDGTTCRITERGEGEFKHQQLECVQITHQE